MTNTTGTQTATIVTTYPTVMAVLALHGIASVDDAREENLFRACGGCGSVMTCTPAEGQTREAQAAILRENFDLDCCPDADDYYF